MLNVLVKHTPRTQSVRIGAASPVIRRRVNKVIRLHANAANIKINQNEGPELVLAQAGLMPQTKTFKLRRFRNFHVDTPKKSFRNGFLIQSQIGGFRTATFVAGFFVVFDADNNEWIKTKTSPFQTRIFPRGAEKFSGPVSFWRILIGFWKTFFFFVNPTHNFKKTWRAYGGLFMYVSCFIKKQIAYFATHALCETNTN